MIYSVVKIQVNGLTFSWFGINPFTHLDKGGQNAHPKSPLFQKFLENIFLETKKPPISLVIEVNRRRVEIFIILVYNRKLRERQISVVKLINILSQAHLKFYLNSFALRMQNDLNIPT